MTEYAKILETSVRLCWKSKWSWVSFKLWFSRPWWTLFKELIFFIFIFRSENLYGICKAVKRKEKSSLNANWAFSHHFLNKITFLSLTHKLTRFQELHLLHIQWGFLNNYIFAFVKIRPFQKAKPETFLSCLADFVCKWRKRRVGMI